MNNLHRPVTILCSYVTLGTYIPALILHQSFKRQGVHSELVALEQLFPEHKLEEIPKLKKAIHGNFKFAKTALKMASKNNESSLDEDKINSLFKHWKKHDKSHFIIFTGFWSEAMNRYLCNAGNAHEIQVDLVHMDSGISPSWKSYESGYGKIRIIKPFDAAQKKLNCYIPPVLEGHKIQDRKKPRVLMHGGGWGIGTYREKISEMAGSGFQSHVIAYETSEVKNESNDDVVYHLLDPEWKPHNGHDFTFPSILDESVKMQSADERYYPYYNLVLNSDAIISKPGGGTLNDSLSSGTPVVFLEPFGEHESENAQLWKDLGYGIDYDEWRRSGFSIALIDELTENLTNAKRDLKPIIQKYYETN